jgi:hypothetical protein
MKAPRSDHAGNDAFTAQQSVANSTDSAAKVSSSLKAPMLSRVADLLAVVASSGASNEDHQGASAPSISQDSAHNEQQVLSSRSSLSFTGFDRVEDDSDATHLSDTSTTSQHVRRTTVLQTVGRRKLFSYQTQNTIGNGAGNPQGLSASSKYFSAEKCMQL